MINKLYEEDGIQGIRIIRDHCDTHSKAKKKDSPINRILESARGKAIFSKKTEHTRDIKELIDYFEKNKLPDRTNKIKMHCVNIVKKYRKEQEELLHDPNPDVRAEAARALGELSPNKNAILALIAVLRDQDMGVRKNAAESLGKLKPTYGGKSPEEILSMIS